MPAQPWWRVTRDGFIDSSEGEEGEYENDPELESLLGKSTVQEPEPRSIYLLLFFDLVVLLTVAPLLYYMFHLGLRYLNVTSDSMNLFKTKPASTGGTLAIAYCEQPLGLWNLVCAGILSAFTLFTLLFINCYSPKRVGRRGEAGQHKASSSCCRTFVRLMVYALLLAVFCWLLVGGIWLYRVPLQHHYCASPLYVFSFWCIQIAISIVVLGSLLFCCMCRTS